MFFRDKKTKFKDSPIIDLLEPRVLYSADPVGLLGSLLSSPTDSAQPLLVSSFAATELSIQAIPVKHSNLDPDISRETLQSFGGEVFDDAGELQRNEIIFIDPGVSDLNLLLADLLSRDSAINTSVYILDAESDGIEQISGILKQYQNLDAVHFFSHGDAGMVQLGNGVLSFDLLGNYENQIAGWSQALGDGADLLFYGCDLASDSAGQLLVEAISRVTGSDVAASDDVTGHAEQSGDWELEFQFGNIESETPLSIQLQNEWVSTLAMIEVSTFNDQLDGGDTSSIDNLKASPGTDGISLREAIIASNNDMGQADEIILLEGTYTLAIAGDNEDDGATGDLDIIDALTITGKGADKTIITGVDTHRVFHIIGDTAINVTISDVKIADGFTSSIIENRGGGLAINGSPAKPNVTLSNVWFSGNNTTGIADSGGAIFNSGNLTVENSLIEDNSAAAGGGIMNLFGGTLSLTNVTLSGNRATDGEGGGLYNGDDADLMNVTVADNTATGSGGGVHNSNLGSAVTTLNNTLIANNTAGTNDDVNGAFVSTIGDNLIETPGSATGLHASDITGIDPNFGSLYDNGGPTLSYALLQGSGAIDAGSSAGSPVTDQRGALRDGAVDIGAYEIPTDAVNLLLSTASDVASPSGAPGLDDWLRGEIIQFGSPDLTMAPGPTDGTFYSLFKADGFAADGTARIDALHYVAEDISVAGFDLFQGDILFSTADEDTYAGTLYDRDDVVVFRPTTPGDYTAGTFSLLIDYSDIGGAFVDGIRGLTLIEEDSVLGDITLNAGDFLILQMGGGQDKNIYRFIPTSLGATTAGTGVGELLIAGADIGVTDKFYALDFLENDTTLGDETLSAGQLLLSMDQTTTVGDNALTVEDYDVYLLNVTATTDGSGTAAATAAILFDGGDLGFDNSKDWTALSLNSISSINDEPTLTATAENPTFTEGAAAQSLFTGASVDTIEGNQTLSSLTLSVSNVTDGVNELLNIDGSSVALSNANSGTTTNNSLAYAVSVSGGTATITLSGGTLSVGQTQTLVDSLSYQNVSTDPSVANRVVTLTQLVDSGGTANGGDDTATLSVASTVTVQSVNNEPTLTATSGNPTFTEGDAAASLFSGASVNTIESGQTLSGLTFTVSNVTDVADELLMIDGGSVSLIHANSGATVTNSLSYTVNVSGSIATVVLSGGALSTTETQTLIDALSYQNSGADPTPADRVVTLTELIDSGGTANSGDNTATLSVASTVTVESVNDEPTLVTSGSNPTFTEGGVVASLFSGTTISTVESGQTLSALTLTLSNVTDGADELLTVDGSSVALTDTNSGTTATNSLTYTVTLGGSTATVVLSGGSLSTVQAQTLVDTLSYQNSSADPTLANRVVTLTELVDSGGTANSGDDTATLAAASTVSVQSVNNEPTLTTTGNNPTFTEGGGASSLFGGTSIATVESSQTLSSLTLTLSNITDGTDELLTVDGSSVALTNGNSGATATNSLTYAITFSGNTATVILSGGTLSTAQAQTLVNTLSYQNNSSDPTLANRVVTLTELVDSGGTANAGDDTATLSAASTVTVQSVNNEPTLTAAGNDPTFTESGVAASLFSGTSVSTVESGQSLSGLTLTLSNITDGADELLTVDGSSVTLTNGNGGATATNSLTYAVSLSGSTATVVLSGGTLSSAQAQTLVNTLSYQNNSADPTVASRVVTLLSWLIPAVRLTRG